MAGPLVQAGKDRKVAKKKHPGSFYLKNNRYVKRVGYEYEFKTVLAKLLFECDPKGFQTKYRTIDIDRVKVDFGEDEVAKILAYHPKFERYRSIRGSWREKVSELPGSGKVIKKAEHEMVFQMIKGVLDHHMEVGGTQRKMWCGSFDERPKDKPLHEWWRGPWSVWEVKRAVTGKYYPGTGPDYYGEDAGDPPCLIAEKRITLYKAHYGGWYDNIPENSFVGGWKEVLILPEDIYTEQEMKDCQDVTRWSEIEAEKAEFADKT